MAKVRPYYAEQGLSAVFYDAVTAADRQLDGDLDLYAGLIPEGGRVLELGTGTGRLAQGLAERGFSVTGVDMAPTMLAQAEARRATLPGEIAARIELKRGDMTALNLGRTFDTVICAFFTPSHIPAGAAWRNTFQVAARHLAPDGRAAFHLPLREAMGRPGPTRTDLPIMDHPLPQGGRLQLYLRDRKFRDDIGKLEQVIEYVELSAAGQPLRRSLDRMTYYIADPVPFAGDAGLTPDRPPVRLGEAGEIFVFRKT